MQFLTLDMPESFIYILFFQTLCDIAAVAN